MHQREYNVEHRVRFMLDWIEILDSLTLAVLFIGVEPRHAGLKHFSFDFFQNIW